MGTVLAVAVALTSRTGIDYKFIGLTTFVGAFRAFWSERARKQPPPPITRYTNPKYMK